MIFTFIPEPRDAQEAAFQIRILDRAKTLMADGYVISFGYTMAALIEEFDAETVGNLAGVCSPQDESYLVKIKPGKETCSCPCCEQHGYCKHLFKSSRYLSAIFAQPSTV